MLGGPSLAEVRFHALDMIRVVQKETSRRMNVATVQWAPPPTMSRTACQTFQIQETVVEISRC
jgi:hypothetical protein